MQALSCGSPMVTRGGMAIPELDKAEVPMPITEKLMSNIRLPTTKPDLGTPMRVPKDSNGHRLCPTPKSVRALGGIKTHASQTQESLNVQDLHQTDHGKGADLENQPTSAPNFTTYSNPAFEFLETTESPTKIQKLPSCIPVDSNGQKLCPTPKSTRSSASPGASKLRIPKATSFQPLETIQSPTVLKDQAKRVLGDSNGQWTQDTPRVSKQFSTSKERPTAFAMSCSENLTPRALFNNSLNEPTTFSTAEMRSAAGSKIRKRTRGEDDAELGNDISRATRSKTEAEKIATFLRSPAARVRPDGTKEEYRLGVADALVKQYTERKLAMQKLCQCDTMKPCLGCNDSMLEESSLKLDSSKPPVSRQLHAVQESPSTRVRLQTPGLGRSTLLRSPLVTSSKKLSEKKTPASRTGNPVPQGSAKKNLSVLLEAQLR